MPSSLLELGDEIDDVPSSLLELGDEIAAALDKLEIVHSCSDNTVSE